MSARRITHFFPLGIISGGDNAGIHNFVFSFNLYVR
jgi:hypothetical protein